MVHNLWTIFEMWMTWTFRNKTSENKRLDIILVS